MQMCSHLTKSIAVVKSAHGAHDLRRVDHDLNMLPKQLGSLSTGPLILHNVRMRVGCQK